MVRVSNTPYRLIYVGSIYVPRYIFSTGYRSLTSTKCGNYERYFKFKLEFMDTVGMLRLTKIVIKKLDISACVYSILLILKHDYSVQKFKIKKR